MARPPAGCLLGSQLLDLSSAPQAGFKGAAESSRAEPEQVVE